MDSQGLEPDVEALVAGLVNSGRLASREEVLREGVRLVDAQEKHRERFRNELKRRIAEADAGETIAAEQAFDELDDYVRSLTRKNAA